MEEKSDKEFSDSEFDSESDSETLEDSLDDINSNALSATSDCISFQSSISDDSLESLAIFLADHVRPLKGQYTEFATSYIPSIIPNTTSRIYCDETSSYTALRLPFKNPIKDRSVALQEKQRSELGESLRKDKLIPASKYILREIQKCKFTDGENTRVHLFYKARQWCEVNKALALDAKYPKISPSIIRDKYSKEHRKASEISRRKQGLKEKPRMFDPPSISPFPIPLELVCNRWEGNEGDDDKLIPGFSDGMANLVREEKIQQSGLRKALRDVFGEIVPIPEMELTEEPWQFKSRNTSLKKQTKTVKKAPFKRTEYPPKSSEEKIQDLRKLLPPLKPENLQTDYLSGIWEPELMTDSFKISPYNYDSRIDKGEIGESDEIDWCIVRDAKEKCKNWLQSIPDSL